jgi:hypothetical protein
MRREPYRGEEAIKEKKKNKKQGTRLLCYREYAVAGGSAGPI